MLTQSEIRAILNKPTHIKPPVAIVNVMHAIKCDDRLFCPLVTAKLYCYACEQYALRPSDELALSMRKISDLFHVTPKKIAMSLQILEQYGFIVTDKSNPSYRYRVRTELYRSNQNEQI